MPDEQSTITLTLKDEVTANLTQISESFQALAKSAQAAQGAMQPQGGQAGGFDNIVKGVTDLQKALGGGADATKTLLNLLNAGAKDAAGSVEGLGKAGGLLGSIFTGAIGEIGKFGTAGRVLSTGLTAITGSLTGTAAALGGVTTGLIGLGAVATSVIPKLTREIADAATATANLKIQVGSSGESIATFQRIFGMLGASAEESMQIMQQWSHMVGDLSRGSASQLYQALAKHGELGVALAEDAVRMRAAGEDFGEITRTVLTRVSTWREEAQREFANATRINIAHIKGIQQATRDALPVWQAFRIEREKMIRTEEEVIRQQAIWDQASENWSKRFITRLRAMNAESAAFYLKWLNFFTGNAPFTTEPEQRAEAQKKRDEAMKQARKQHDEDALKFEADDPRRLEMQKNAQREMNRLKKEQADADRYAREHPVGTPIQETQKRIEELEKQGPLARPGELNAVRDHLRMLRQQEREGTQGTPPGARGLGPDLQYREPPPGYFGGPTQMRRQGAAGGALIGGGGDERLGGGAEGDMLMRESMQTDQSSNVYLREIRDVMVWIRDQQAEGKGGAIVGGGGGDLAGGAGADTLGGGWAGWGGRGTTDDPARAGARAGVSRYGGGGGGGGNTAAQKPQRPPSDPFKAAPAAAPNWSLGGGGGVTATVAPGSGGGLAGGAGVGPGGMIQPGAPPSDWKTPINDTNRGGGPVVTNGQPPNGDILAEAQKIAAAGGPAAMRSYMRQKGYRVDDQWCGNFAAAAVTEAGGKPPKDPQVASNWRNWGEEVSNPQPGDIAVARPGWSSRGSGATGAAGSHVTVVRTGIDPKTGRVGSQGGNQRDPQANFRASQFQFFRARPDDGTATARRGPPQVRQQQQADATDQGTAPGEKQGDRGAQNQQGGGAGLRSLAADRERFAKELEANPALRDKVLRIAANEQGSNPQGTQAVLESMMNRASYKGTSLAAQAKWTGEGGYYEQGNMGRGALENQKQRGVLEASLGKTLSGSNISDFATENASQGLAARRRANREMIFTQEFGGESFFQPGRVSGAGNVRRYRDWRANLRDDGDGGTRVARGDGGAPRRDAQESGASVDRDLASRGQSTTMLGMAQIDVNFNNMPRHTRVAANGTGGLKNIKVNQTPQMATSGSGGGDGEWNSEIQE